MSRRPVQQPVKAVVFDCWNTLFYAERRPLALRLIASKLLHHRMRYRLTKRFEHSIMLSPESNADAAARRLLRGFGVPAPPGLAAQVSRALRDSHQQPYPETIDMLRELDRDYNLGLITNSYEIAFEPLRHRFHLDSLFAALIASYEVGLLKPDRRIFELTLERLGAKAAETVMVGDNLRDDVEAAEAIGMHAVLLDRTGRHPREPRRITSLTELPAYLEKLRQGAVQ